jgi:hypothetical protein
MSPCPHQGGTQGAKESISNDGLFYSNTKSDSYLGETLLSECREQGDCHFIVTSFTLSAIFLTATLTPFVLRASPQIQKIARLNIPTSYVVFGGGWVGVK